MFLNVELQCLADVLQTLQFRTFQRLNRNFNIDATFTMLQFYVSEMTIQHLLWVKCIATSYLFLQVLVRII